MTPNSIQIELAAPRHRFFVEEGVRLDVTMTAPAGLPLEPVELNFNRTRVLLENNQGVRQIFTGQQFFTLHHVSILSNIGKAIPAPSFPLRTGFDLMNFTRPLTPGRYQLGLEYQTGLPESQPVLSNVVEFEVLPAPMQSQQYRWMAGKYRRDSLAAIWTAGEAGGTRSWFYQVSDRRNPGVVFSAWDLRMPETANIGPPVLAHITGPAMSRRFRSAIWPVAGGCGWVRFNPRARIGGPRDAPHGLRTAVLLDPPLQRRDGGLSAVFLGEDTTGQPSLSLFEVDEKDQASFQLFPWRERLPEEAVVVWSGGEDPLTCSVYGIEGQSKLVLQPVGGERAVLHQDEGTLRFLRCDQQDGEGRVLAVREDGDRQVRSVLGWDLADPDAPTVTLARRALEPVDHERAIVGAAANDEGAGMTLLFRTREGRFFASTLAGVEESAVTPPLDHAPELVVTPRNGAYLVSFGPQGRKIASAVAKPAE